MIAKLTTTYQDDLRSAKVPAIKIVRNYTGMGLREAKGVVDDLCEYGKAEMEITSFANGNWNDLQSELRGHDIYISKMADSMREYAVYADDIRGIAAQALLSGHDDLAQDLLHIINVYGLKKSVDSIGDDATLVE